MLVRSPAHDAHALFEKFFRLISMKRGESVLYDEYGVCTMKFQGGSITLTKEDIEVYDLKGVQSNQCIVMHDLSVYFDCFVKNSPIKLRCVDKSVASPYMFQSTGSKDIVLYIGHQFNRFTAYPLKEGSMKTLLDCDATMLTSTQYYDTLITEEQYFQNSLLFDTVLSYEEYTKLLNILSMIPIGRYITAVNTHLTKYVQDDALSAALKRIQGTIDTIVAIDAFDSL